MRLQDDYVNFQSVPHLLDGPELLDGLEHFKLTPGSVLQGVPLCWVHQCAVSSTAYSPSLYVLDVDGREFLCGHDNEIEVELLRIAAKLLVDVIRLPSLI